MPADFLKLSTTFPVKAVIFKGQSTQIQIFERAATFYVPLPKEYSMTALESIEPTSKLTQMNVDDMTDMGRPGLRQMVT